MLLVAATPSGSIPRISPTSTPFLLSEWTQHPTSSRSGWSRMPSMAALPTLPVAHWMTRTAPLSQLERVLVYGPVGQSEVITPTVVGENRGKTFAVDAPNRFDTISARTLR